MWVDLNSNRVRIKAEMGQAGIVKWSAGKMQQTQLPVSDMLWDLVLGRGSGVHHRLSVSEYGSRFRPASHSAVTFTNSPPLEREPVFSC